MSKVVFDTEGELDFRAITTFGINAKPKTDSPIGFFGTGLKYSLAVLAREIMNKNVQSVTIFRGNEKYTINTDEEKFRETNLNFIKLIKEKMGKIYSNDLPFTTDLGKKWELWQAFRELYSNTLDEKGSCYKVSGDVTGVIGRTKIVIDSEQFSEVFDNKHDIFLENAQSGNFGVQIIEKPSKHIYFRGVRVYDLEKPARYTYNILDRVELTEDRTIKYNYIVDYYVAMHLVCVENKQELIETVLLTNKTNYEGKIDFEANSFSPSSKFEEAVITHVDNKDINKSAVRLIEKHNKPRVIKLNNLLAEKIELEDWNGLISLIRKKDALFMN